MDEESLTAAIANSVHWYDAVMSAHGLAVEHRKNAWLCKEKVPPFYSNMITLDRFGSQGPLITEIGSTLLRPWTIKDSYNSIDLVERGFDVLFDAEWFGRSPDQNWPSRTGQAPPVQTVRSESELERWVEAWGETPIGRPVFVPGLLQNDEVEFVYVDRGSYVSAGLVANRSDDVIGITNAFGSPREVMNCIHHLSHRYDLAVVGYGRKRQVEFLTGFGFRQIGKLRIWINR